MLKCNIINGNTTTEFAGQVILEFEENTSTSDVYGNKKQKYAMSPVDAIDLASCIQKMAHEVGMSKKR